MGTGSGVQFATYSRGGGFGRPHPSTSAMILGEKQSDVIDMTQVCEDHNGEMYLTPIHLVMHRPLGLGSLIYAKLMRVEIEGEVYWNHFEGSVTVDIPGRYQGVMRERDMPAARTQQLAIVEDFVKWVQKIDC